jgi:hypothetical protein
MYLESENEENDDIILNDNDITFEYDCEALKKTYKNIFLQDMYYDDTSDDEDSLPVQSLESFTVNNNREQNNDYSTCILVDLVDGKIQTCGRSQQIRPLNHLIGMWQLDREIVKKTEEEGKKLGICMQHFNVDQKYHKNKLKTTIPVIGDDYIKSRCLFCSKYVFFFCRSGSCSSHSWNILDKNVQVPCNGQITCHALNNFGAICKPEVDIVTKAQYICCECYQNHEGHLHVKMGSGKSLFDCEKFGLHNNDHSTSLELLGKWLLTVAKSENIEYKEKVLTNILNPALQIIKETQEMEARNSSSKAVVEISAISDLLYTKVPSPFVLNVFLKMHKIKLEDTNSFSLNEQSKTFGQNMAKTLWNSRTMLLEQKNKIKMPDSLDEYYNVLPPFLTCFFDGMLTDIYKKKLELSNIKLQQKNKPPKEIDILSIKKIITFLVSIIVHIAFPKMEVWFPQVMASLSRRPRLLGSMRDLFSTLQIMAHTSGNERKLEIERMSRSQPEIRLKKNDPKIWNLSIIDNIDFKEKSFTYYNIFNTTRNTSHATLRMCFQIPLSFNTQEGPEDILQNISEKDLFGMNNVAESAINLFDKLLVTSLQMTIENDVIKYQKDFDASTIYQKMMKCVEHGCNYSPPNIVILKPGGTPNKDAGIFESVDMYYNDYEINQEDYIDIVADESIFARLVKYRKEHPNVRPLLGQWHTSKDMCSVLITIFSSYGIFDIASTLGVKYLDKLESVVDYRSTVRVLELIWTAVGLSINIWLKKKKMDKNQILDGDFNKNMILKVWFLYYQWAGIFIAHRIGIRCGNFKLQKYCLTAFSPLFPAAGKMNYMKSVAHYLAILSQYPKLEEKLNAAASIKTSEDRAGHLFGFDEALETLGVKFIKGFINGNVIDEDNMKSQISAAQTEHERIGVLFSEYLNDTTTPHGTRAIKTHKETMWDLVNHLLDAFNVADNKALECNLWKITKPCALNPIGVQRLFDCYTNGHERMNSICRQEVFGTEKIEKKGRRALNVTKTTMKNINENKKAEKKKPTQFSDNSLQIQPVQIIRSFSESSYLQPQTQPHLHEPVENVIKKRSRRVTTLEAKNTLLPLIQLIQQGEEISEEKILTILPTLNMKADSSNTWDADRVKNYLSRNRPNKK